MIIKETCEDFIVREIPLEDYLDEEGSYHVYELEKRNYTTQRALAHISSSLRIPLKNIGFAGTKDKQAVTYQYITIKGARKEKVASLELKDIKLTFKGYRKEPFHMGGLLGNAFEIIIKGVELLEAPSEFYVPNYFDEQRFSTSNVSIGKSILKKNYKEAVEIILSQDRDFEEKIQEYLSKQENDYVGALRIIPRSILMFYVHAIQSYVFNQRLAEQIRDLVDCKEVIYSQGSFAFPREVLKEVVHDEGELIGFDSDKGYKDIEPYDFVNKSLPELSLEGGSRPLFSHVKDCTLEKIDVGVRVRFSLDKGSYATIVLKQLFS